MLNIKSIGNTVASVMGGSSKSGSKRKMRYGVYVKGARVSRHSTKRNALKKARGIRGARVRQIGGRKRR